MTAEEHAHVQELEGLVKRYRSKIARLNTEWAVLKSAVDALDAARRAIRDERLSQEVRDETWVNEADNVEAVVAAARALVQPETP